MSTDVNTLMEMGFPENRAQRALAKTSYKGVQVAMDWLFAHSEDPDIDDPFEMPKGHRLDEASPEGSGTTVGNETSTSAYADESMGEPAGGDNPQPAQAQSLKCDECGKLLKSELDAQAHAARTQHSSFSESTEEIRPLTEEERKEQLEKVQEKIKQKRQDREEKEKQDTLAREKHRRTTGKEVGKYKQKYEEDEIRRIAEQRRKEKMDDKLARQKILDEIEKDKRERAAAQVKSSNAGASAAAASSTPSASSSSSSTVSSTAKEYTQCRIQVRLTNGDALTQSFSAKESLAAVRLYVQMNRTDGQGPFNLMTTFPKKLFNDEDMEKPLTELGLVPSAVLIVAKAQ